MKLQKIQFPYCVFAIAALFVNFLPIHAQESSADGKIPVSMTVTASVADGKQIPTIDRAQLQLRRGKERLDVTDWVQARGDRAGLELYILIDDASDPGLGLHLDDLRNFINAQPATTLVGVGYMSNATFRVAQDLTVDHAKAAEALRLPLGSPGAYGNSYHSVVDLMKRWPESGNRHEVLMLTDGVDRGRHRSFGTRGFSINPDAETASLVGQKTGTMIHTIYFPGSRRYHHNYWDLISGQTNLARLSDNTGGGSYYLGLHSPVSIAPYLADLQSKLESQYILSFSATPAKKAQLQTVRLSTEIAGVDLITHNAVWVPASR